MCAKRYIQYTFPVEHINGKHARTAQKVKNADNSNPSDKAFYYGYKYRGRESSRFGIREIPRNLVTNPYTTDENANKDLFKRSVQAAQSVIRNVEQTAKALQEFRGQNRYVTLYNYVIAQCHAEGGIVPTRWE